MAASFWTTCQGWEAVKMGYQFTLILNRKITDEETTSLREAGCAEASVTTVPYPTGADPDLIVTQLDFDDTESSTLEEAITGALDAVKVVPDLTVATFSAPAQPNGMPPDEDDDWSDLDPIPASNGALSE
jgi:hypothetical protein